jgi:hypothetical protein
MTRVASIRPILYPHNANNGVLSKREKLYIITIFVASGDLCRKCHWIPLIYYITLSSVDALNRLSVYRASKAGISNRCAVNVKSVAWNLVIELYLLFAKSHICKNKMMFSVLKIEASCTAFKCYLVTFMLYSRYILINLYFMTINNTWVYREKIIYN